MHDVSMLSIHQVAAQPSLTEHAEVDDPEVYCGRALPLSPWEDVCLDVIERCLDVLLVEGHVTVALCDEYRRHLIQFHDWVSRASPGTFVDADEGVIRKYLLESVGKDETLAGLSGALAALGGLYWFLREAGIRMDDPIVRLGTPS